MILRNHFFVCTETDDEKQDINTAVIPMEEKKWNEMSLLVTFHQVVNLPISFALVTICVITSGSIVSLALVTTAVE